MRHNGIAKDVYDYKDQTFTNYQEILCENVLGTMTNSTVKYTAVDWPVKGLSIQYIFVMPAVFQGFSNLLMPEAHKLLTPS